MSDKPQSIQDASLISTDEGNGSLAQRRSVGVKSKAATVVLTSNPAIALGVAALVSGCQPVAALNSGTVDRTPSALLLPQSDTGQSTTDRRTKNTDLSFSVMGDPLDKVTVTLEKSVLDQKIVETQSIFLSADGSGTVTLNGLSQGTWLLKAEAVDEKDTNLRNFSKELSLTIDLTPPDPAIVRVVGRNDLRAADVDSAKTLLVQGEPSSSLRIVFGDPVTGIELANTSGLSSTDKSVSLSGDLTLRDDMAYSLTFITTDLAGNEKISYGLLEIGNANSIALTAGSDSGRFDNDAITASDRLEFSVRGAASTSYNVIAQSQGGGSNDSDINLGTLLTNDNGIGSLTVSDGVLSDDARYKITLQNSQNTTLATTNIEIDRTAPVAASIKIFGESGLQTNASGKVGAFSISGGEQDGYFSLTIGGVTVVTEKSLASRFDTRGSAEVILTEAQISALALETGKLYDLQLNTFDAAGNSQRTQLTLDITAVIDDNGNTITGGNVLPMLTFNNDASVDDNPLTVSFSTLSSITNVMVVGLASQAGAQYQLVDANQKQVALFRLDSAGKADVSLEMFQFDGDLETTLSIQPPSEANSGATGAMGSVPSDVYTVTLSSSVDLAAVSDSGFSSQDNLTAARTWQLNVETIASSLPKVSLVSLDSSETKLMASVVATTIADSNGLSRVTVNIDETSLAGSGRQQQWRVVVNHERGDVEDDVDSGLVVSFDARRPDPVAFTGDQDSNTSAIAVMVTNAAAAATLDVNGTAGSRVTVYSNNDSDAPNNVAEVILDASGMGIIDLSVPVASGETMFVVSAVSESGEKNDDQTLVVTLGASANPSTAIVSHNQQQHLTPLEEIPSISSHSIHSSHSMHSNSMPLSSSTSSENQIISSAASSDSSAVENDQRIDDQIENQQDDDFSLADDDGLADSLAHHAPWNDTGFITT